jgi:hypothetical protein
MDSTQRRVIEIFGIVLAIIVTSIHLFLKIMTSQNYRVQNQRAF